MVSIAKLLRNVKRFRVNAAKTKVMLWEQQEIADASATMATMALFVKIPCLAGHLNSSNNALTMGRSLG